MFPWRSSTVLWFLGYNSDQPSYSAAGLKLCCSMFLTLQMGEDKTPNATRNLNIKNFNFTSTSLRTNRTRILKAAKESRQLIQTM